MCWESGKIRHTNSPAPPGIAPRQVWGVFFFVSHSFSPETKKRHQISLDGHKTKAIPIFNVVVFIHFPSKKACPKSSAAPFRQNRPLSFRNHRSEAPADSGYILLKSDRIFQNCGRCSLVRMNRINGNNRRHIFYRTGLQMPFNQIVSACVIHIRHIVKQNDIQVRFPRIQLPEILRESHFKTNPDSDRNACYFKNAIAASLGKMLSIPPPQSPLIIEPNGLIWLK